MRIIDLTQPISPAMSVYPGTPAPVFETLASLEAGGFEEKRITITSHTGTHLDAPAHLIPGGKTLDRFPADRFIGNALVADVAGEVSLCALQAHGDLLREMDFLLLRTGWSRHWGSPEYFQGYPTLSPEAAAWLARLGLKGVGIDAPSFDPLASDGYPNHREFLSRDILLIENLGDLAPLPATPFLFSCLPLKITDADGAPARAVALF